MLTLLIVRMHFTAMRYVADVDECAVNSGGCDLHANCTNTYGSFTCTCIEGYLGDGFNCSGNNASRDF